MRYIIGTFQIKIFNYILYFILNIFVLNFIVYKKKEKNNLKK